MNASLRVILQAILFFHVICSSPSIEAQKSVEAARCSALEASKPAQFISFEGTDRKAWRGNKYVKGVVLRLTNDSDCTIVLVTPFGGAEEAPAFRIKEGKLIRNDEPIGPTLVNGSHVDLLYYITLPRQETAIAGFADTLDFGPLRSGRSILFSVPLKVFKEGGEVAVPFVYESSPELSMGFPRWPTVRFSASQLPKSVLR